MWRLLELENKCGVELVTEGNAPALTEDVVAEVFGRIEAVSTRVVSTGNPETIAASAITVVV
jgi:hypothetical protein